MRQLLSGSAVLVALLCAGILAGCGTPPPEIAPAVPPASFQIPSRETVTIKVDHGTAPPTLALADAADYLVALCATSDTTPGCQKRVRWLVEGIEPGESIRIRYRVGTPGALACLGQDYGPGAYADVRCSTTAEWEYWKYTILLFDSAGDPPIATLDPGIIFPKYP